MDIINKSNKIDTIVIIGNGFDLWQGLNTSYSEFEKYYFEHLDGILKKLNRGKHVCVYPNGEQEEYSDVEMIFGDTFDPCELDSDFWNNFEESLSYIDDESINLYFGKEKEDLEDLRKCAYYAKEILTEAFYGWISTINVSKKRYWIFI